MEHTGVLEMPVVPGAITLWMGEPAEGSLAVIWGEARTLQRAKPNQAWACNQHVLTSTASRITVFDAKGLLAAEIEVNAQSALLYKIQPDALLRLLIQARLELANRW